MTKNPAVLFAAGAILASLDDIKARLRKKVTMTDIGRYKDFDQLFQAALKVAVQKSKK